MNRALVTGVLVIGLVLLAPAAPAGACGAGERQHAREDRLRGPAPWVIGDSTGILAVPVLRRLGIDADARGCRPFGDGVAMIARRRGPRLPNAVVLALGANGSVTRAQIAAARRALGPRRFLLLVTPRNYRAGRAAMLAAARAHPDRVRTLDWVARSAGHPEWFGGDGLHVTHEGARAWAQLIREGLAPFFGPPRRGRPLGLPHDAAGRRVQPCGAVRAHGRRTRVFLTRNADGIPCRFAREVMRRPRLAPGDGWRFHDWRRVGRGPWTDVLARRDRDVVIAGITR